LLEASFDSVITPTKVIFKATDNTYAHKTIVIKATATANGLSIVYEIRRKIDPCPRATIVKPTATPSEMVIRSGSFSET